MCKVGGPRCNGSHTPSAKQRAKRKANKAYRKALADTIAEQTGDDNLARAVAHARMTDLHEVALLAGIDQDAVARRAGSATYTSPDGETVTVDAEPTGKSRKTAADSKSKLLFGDVRAAYHHDDDDVTPWEQAVLDGDRDELKDLESQAQESYADMANKIPDNIEDMDFEDLKKLHSELYKDNERAQELSPHTNPEVDKALGDMYSEIERRATDKAKDKAMGTDGDPTVMPWSDSLDEHVVSDVYAARDMRDSLGDLNKADTADLVAAMQASSAARREVYAATAAGESRDFVNSLGGDVAGELTRRAETSDNLKGFPVYTWPDDTSGRILPDNAELADNAEYYYGLTPVAESEYSGIYGTSANDFGDVDFKGMSPAGQAVYRNGTTLAFVDVPGDDTDDVSRGLYTKYWADQAEDFNDAGAIELGDTSTAQYFGMASDELTDAINDVDSTGFNPLNREMRKNLNDALNDPRYSDPSDTSDERIEVLSRAAGGYEELVESYRDIPRGDGRSRNDDEAYLDAMRCVTESRSRDARRELGRTLDARAAAEGDNHAMSYSDALKVAHAGAYNRAPDTKKAELATKAVVNELDLSAATGREPDWGIIASELQNYQADKEKLEYKAQRLLSGAERKYGGDYLYTTHDNRTSWNAGGPTAERLSDLVTTPKGTNAPQITFLTTKDDAEIAAAYFRSQGTRQVDDRIEAIHPHIKDDGTYSSVRVNQVSDESRAAFLDHVAEGTVGTWDKDGAAHGVVRNAADEDSMELAAQNYKVVYATAMNDLIGVEDIDERNPDKEDHEILEREQAYRHRLNELYDAAKSGDEDAKTELVNTAAAAYAEDDDPIITRQYVDPDQGSLF